MHVASCANNKLGWGNLASNRVLLLHITLPQAYQAIVAWRYKHGFDTCADILRLTCLQAVVNNERYAVKNRLPEAIYAYFNEKACLQALASCPAVIKLKMAGRLQDSLYPCIVTKSAGGPVQHLSAVQYSLAKTALITLHQAGAAHGDI